MRNILIQDDIRLIENKIKTFETNTGCDLLLVQANSSDQYPGAAWRFGVISSFIVTFIFSLFFEFEHSYLWPIFMLVLILIGTLIGQSPWAKKFALTNIEIERECFEKAVELFYSLGVSQTGHKFTVMIMVSVLEREIIILVDEDIKKRISQSHLDKLVEIMKKYFKQGDMAAGYVQSIDLLEQKIINEFQGKVSSSVPLKLSDKIHFI